MHNVLVAIYFLLAYLFSGRWICCDCAMRSDNISVSGCV